MFITPAYAQAAGDAAGSGFSLGGLFPLVLIFVIFYFLLIRPQQKRAKEHKMTVENLRRGDQVVTAGGLLAKVTKVIDDNEIEVEISQGVKVKLVRSTISGVATTMEG